MALSAVGLEPVLEPVLTTRVLGDAAAEIAVLGADDWLVLTSPRAIRAVALSLARVPRVAVVGEASRQIALELGLRVEFVSPSRDARGLWHHIEQQGAGTKVCFPRSSRSKPPVLVGVDLRSPILYEVNNRAFDVSIASRVEVVTFTSPSAVESVFARIGEFAIPTVSIGPTTSAAIIEAGGRVLLESARREFESLAVEIAREFRAG
jgi:uroporphyrinogen-III synthase